MVPSLGLVSSIDYEDEVEEPASHHWEEISTGEEMETEPLHALRSALFNSKERQHPSGILRSIDKGRLR